MGTPYEAAAENHVKKRRGKAVRIRQVGVGKVVRIRQVAYTKRMPVVKRPADLQLLDGGQRVQNKCYQDSVDTVDDEETRLSLAADDNHEVSPSPLGFLLCRLR